MQYLFKAVIGVCLFAVPLLGVVVMADSTAVINTLSLEDAVAEARAANPGLAAIQARAKALAEIPSQVESLPDPRLSLNVMNLPLDSFSFTQEAMTQFQVGITQALPYPGKLALRSQAAILEANAAVSATDEQRLQLIRDVKTVWWNLFYLDRALDTVARNQTLFGQFVSIAETRYQVGQGLQQDILLAQLELSRLRDSDLRLQNRRENELARMLALLGRQAVERQVAEMINITADVDEKLPVLAREAVLLAQAETARPLLSAQRQNMDAARARVNLAKKDHAPDFMVGAVYGLRRGDNPDGGSRSDFGSVLFSMNLPLYSGSKQDRAVDQRNGEWMQQKYQLQDRRNQIVSEVRRAINDYQFAAQQVVLFKKEIITQAQQTVAAMLAGYQAGKVDFLNLVRSQTTLYNYETQHWKALSSANQALARLVAAVGEEKIFE